MKVFVKNGGDVYNVDPQPDGSWIFKWDDCGIPLTYTYPVDVVEKHLGNGNWNLVQEIFNKQPNYAAAFNMWMDAYMNDPQAYEDSHDSAVRHLKEKLNGEEPSYGSVCQEILIKYLEKV